MNALLASFVRSLPALPLLMAALYLLSIVGVSSARELAQQLLRVRIVYTLVLSISCLGRMLLPIAH
ncbi:hypothetical protein [Croceicoccus naphthovorans]|uniref:Uncharacterized protein n=1 Tax=Croceicoccus naphthovorans TaxID=1348774 RepID=A0A0G3XBZ3_9SPHN|nr:hypothetical protein [Croceicoccus naphthovorans]AKM09045.1 hypothetical protein AB433_02185 [Croceicoccus naphthovorans]MBB3991454.1 hypothetical protein [Croceicoccus naphthovorans]